MYLVNHFLDVSLFGIDIPNETAASTTNGENSIMSQVNECNALYGRYPNFILVSLDPFLPSSSPICLLSLDQRLSHADNKVMQLDWISVGSFSTVQGYLNGVGSL